LVPSRLFISNAGGKDGENQTGGSVLETLLSLILSEKAGINLQENTASSKPLEDFIRQFTGTRSTGEWRSGEEVGVSEFREGRIPLNQQNKVVSHPGARVQAAFCKRAHAC